MESTKRKPVLGKSSRKSIRRIVENDSNKIFSSTTVNHIRSTFNTCPHCAGIPFETIVGICEDKICPDCEHKKTAWLIQKYQAQIDARKKKKFAPVEKERRHRSKQQNLIYNITKEKQSWQN